MDDDESDYSELMIPLRDHAGHLNSISRPKLFKRVFYELMSGALVWTDETNRRTPWEVINALRVIVAYRTSLMLDDPREEFAEMWEESLKLFPNWVGFRPERRTPTQRLMAIYRRGDISSSKCLRDLEREIENDEAS